MGLASSESERLRPSWAAPGVAPDGRIPRSVRTWGAILFVLTFLEGALGVLSAGQRSTAPTDLLAAHVAFGVALVAVSGWVLAVAWRMPERPARIATGFTTGALACTGGTGALFLLTGFAQGADIDRALALLSLAGTVLMMAWGAGRRGTDR